MPISMKNFFKIPQSPQIKAFSLVEILVVLGLFSSIATLSLGALFNAQAINAHLQATQAILDNINLSSQTITRDIRFGSLFHCNLLHREHHLIRLKYLLLQHKM